MAITVVRPSERRLEPVQQQKLAEGVPDDVKRAAKRQIVSEDRPYVHIAQLPPGAAVPLHSHSEDEVTIVLSGTARLGGQECEAGSLLVVPADEAYDLEVVGDEPLTFAVVRPRAAEYAGS